MKGLLRGLCITHLLAVCFTARTYAQSPEVADPVAAAPIRLGPIGLAPHVTLTDLGVDTNVFNEPTNPKRDFTFTFSPGADIWLRTRRGVLSLTGSVDFVYFNEHSSQRSLTSNALGQYELRLDRIRPYISARTLNTEQRPGFEIDTRAKHYETDFRTGTEVRIASKTSMRFELQQLRYSFDSREVFDGRQLSQELNRRLRTGSLSWRQRLTPLTTWVTTIARESERFEFQEIRNSDSFRLSTGFELGRFALIRGSAFIGYRTLKAADGGLLPTFTGVTGSADVSYTAPTQTRINAVAGRDIQYSYDQTTPYYVQTSWTLTVTQRIVGSWDAAVTGGRDRLAYQSVGDRNDRTDFAGRFGGSVGYTLNDQIRLSFDINSFFRRSDIPGRDYGGVRSGLSVTYAY